jgi:hypothetical protein
MRFDVREGARVEAVGVLRVIDHGRLASGRSPFRGGPSCGSKSDRVTCPNVMDTIARHPLTALVAVVVLVALALHFGIQPPPAPPPPPPSPPVSDETGIPGITTASVGEKVTLTGKAGQISPRVSPLMILTVRQRAVSCRFPEVGPGAEPPLAGVREGDEATVEGVVESVDTGFVTLADCKLVPGPKP